MVKKILTVKDTWAIWHPADKRTIKRGHKHNPKQLKNWYGIDSKLWRSLLKTQKLKPEILLVGENPSKNNDKIINNGLIAIQCFHSNSVLDRSIKAAIEANPFFDRAAMTDAFLSAYEANGKKINLREIKRKYPKVWNKIYNSAKRDFINKINSGKGRLAIIALGSDAFNYIHEFLQLNTFLKPRIKKFTVSGVKHDLKIYKVDHPSPLNTKYRKFFSAQLKTIAIDLK